jgi:hypothetical protein
MKEKQDVLQGTLALSIERNGVRKLVWGLFFGSLFTVREPQFSRWSVSQISQTVHKFVIVDDHRSDVTTLFGHWIAPSSLASRIVLISPGPKAFLCWAETYGPEYLLPKIWTASAAGPSRQSALWRFVSSPWGSRRWSDSFAKNRFAVGTNASCPRPRKRACRSSPVAS